MIHQLAMGILKRFGIWQWVIDHLSVAECQEVAHRLTADQIHRVAMNICAWHATGKRP